MSERHSDPARIGWIGLGLMGQRMLPHLLDAGHEVAIFVRRDDAAAPFVDRGATLATDPAEVAGASDVVITIVAMPTDVEEVYLGPRGLISGVGAGSLLIDMTTSSPALAGRIHEAAAERGADAIDAPVSGGPTGAESAGLSIMIGGDEEPVARAMPILERLGTTIVHHGPAGAGQAAKATNQILVGGSMLAIGEALVFGRALGLDPERVLETLAAGIAGSGLLRYMWPRMVEGDLEPGFRVEHLIKDLTLALEAGHAAGASLPGTALAKELYHAVDGAGLGAKGTQALITAIERTPPRDGE